MELAAIQAAVNIDNNTTVITPDHIRASRRNDKIYTTLINAIN